MNEEQNKILELLQSNKNRLDEIEKQVEHMDIFLRALLPKNSRLIENPDGTTTLLVPYEKQ